jgi:hypothetical protein
MSQDGLAPTLASVFAVKFGLFWNSLDMRLVLRVLGTWLLGIGFILLIIDGTRSLAVNAITMTPLSDTWTSLHPASLEATKAFLTSRLFGPILEPAMTAFLSFPSYAVFAVPGVILALLGRSRTRRIAQYTES